MIVCKGDRVIVIAAMELGRQIAEQDALRLLGILAGLRDLPDQIRVHNTPPRTCPKRQRSRFRAGHPGLPKAKLIARLTPTEDRYTNNKGGSRMIVILRRPNQSDILLAFVPA
jgi:hypothetical protein